MEDIRTPQQEAAEDLFFGQVVIIWARWFLILAGAIVILWTATEQTELVLAILPILALMAINFYLHMRYLIERPANQALVIVASLLDLTIITLVVFIGPEDRGLENQIFIFYYLVILAFAFVFPRKITTVYTALAVIGYAGVCFLADRLEFTAAGQWLVATAGYQKFLVRRLITIAAMGVLGTYYWRIQRSRRRAAVGSPPS